MGCVCVFVTDTHVEHTSGGQRTTLWNLPSPSPFTRVPRIKLRSSDLWDKHLHPLSHLFSSVLENMILNKIIC